MSSPQLDFQDLDPSRVLDSIESLGFHTTGVCLQLNSYENRVFEVQLEGGEKLVAKYYRPHRWSEDAIREEHEFLWDLKSEGVPAVAPLKCGERGGDPNTLFRLSQLWWSVFPRVRGRSPDELLENHFKQVGRRLAQIHNIGFRKKAPHRLRLSVEDYARPALKHLEPRLTPETRRTYLTLADSILKRLEPMHHELEFGRIHGDCHRGNLLFDGTEFFFVDFDDFLSGPAVQDFWMLLDNGDEGLKQLELLLSGYEELRRFDDRELEYMEPLRGLRLIHYSGWIAQRWSDPSFPRLFPEFATPRYWEEEIQSLREIAES